VSQALEGIRIVDLTMGWAGPLATRHLADMGADVIKVESCVRFDWWRSWEATPAWIADDGAEKSNQFNMVNRNKRGITLDLEHPEGRRLLLELVATANAVVENYSGGVLPKLNLSYDVFRQVRNDILLLSMPAFGSTGPWRMFRAYGSTVEQSSGLPHLNGHAEDPPTMLHVAYGDAVGGLNGAAALLTALRHQRRTGQGQYVDLSQVESLFPLAAHGILQFAATGQAPPRQGNFSPTCAPHGVYPCASKQDEPDEWLVLQVQSEDQWRVLQSLAPELQAFGGLHDRLARVDALDQAIAAWTRLRPAHALMTELQSHGVRAAATHAASTLMDDAHLSARGYWQWLERAVVGNQPNPSAPYRLGPEPMPVRAPAPTLGQHNRDVLGGILGLDDEKLAALEADGIIGTRPRMPRRRSADRLIRR
jgi:crotonobetainyl-CoA:carnitine CoA-transferase CaiB-like acyl-CoA transferase